MNTGAESSATQPPAMIRSINEARLAFLTHESGFQGHLVDCVFDNTKGYRLSWCGEQYYFYTAKQCLDWVNIHIDDR
jgi:hypothetical protein